MTEEIQLTDTHKMILACMSLLPDIPVSAKELFTYMNVDDASMIYFFDSLEDLKDYGWIEGHSEGYIMKKDEALLVHQLIKPSVKNCYQFINYFIKLFSDINTESIDRIKKHELHVISILQNLHEDSSTKATLINVYANFLALKGKYDEANLLLGQAIEIQKELNAAHPQLAIFYNDLSKLFLDQNNFEKSRQLARKSLDIARLHHNNKELAEVQINSYYLITESFYKQKNYRLALTYLLRALEIAYNKIPEKHDILTLLHHQIANIYRHLKDFNNSLLHIEKAMEHNSKNANKQKRYTLPEGELKAQKEAFKQLIKHQKNLERLQKAGYALLFILLATIVFLGIVHYFVK